MDLDARVIERWTPDDDRPEICDSTLRWSPSTTSEGFDLDVEHLFRKALDQ